MYHEISDKERKRGQRRRLIALLVVCLLAVGCYFGYQRIRIALNEQAALAMRQSILDAANQCAAVEGAYPLSLDYLKENYGLTINSDDYVITYQAYANNIAPSVVVIPR